MDDLNNIKSYISYLLETIKDKLKDDYSDYINITISEIKISLNDIKYDLELYGDKYINEITKKVEKISIKLNKILTKIESNGQILF